MEALCKECHVSEEAGGNLVAAQALHIAVQNNHPKCVEVLIKAGADVNRKYNQDTLLICAAENGFNDCISLLIEAGADVNIPTVANYTPIMLAARHGYIDCVETLIEVGADVNRKNRDWDTALLFGARNGYPKCVDALIKAGADVNYVRKGLAVLHSAAIKNESECVKLLLEAGAKVNVWDNVFQTPIVYATDYRCLKLLLKSGADVNGLDLITSAAECGRYNCLKLLVRAGADVNLSRYQSQTPLLILSQSPYETEPKILLKILKLLLKSGAKINVYGGGHNHNALCYYMLARLKFSVQRDEEVCTLLYAAGETVDRAGDVLRKVSISEYLLQRELKLCLKNMCRNSIRKHMISLDPQTHLFNRIPQLGLPPSLTEYLLYNMSLDDDGDDGGDDDNNSDDDKEEEEDVLRSANNV